MGHDVDRRENVMGRFEKNETEFECPLKFYIKPQFLHVDKTQLRKYRLVGENNTW